MTGGFRRFARPGSRRAADALTDVELIWIEKRLEHWIRFGRHAAERILTRRTRILSYRADAVFAFVRWSANDFGTIRSRIDIVRAVRPGEPFTTLPFIRPGGEILLSIEGWPKVRMVLDAIDRIDAADIDPCEVAPDHWRHVHNRLATAQAFREYTPERHLAWLRRKAFEQ